MASGQKLASFTAQHNQPPATNFALVDTSNNQPILVFDATTNWDAVFADSLPGNYSGGGLTCTIVWTSASATTNSTIWNLAIERNQDGTDQSTSDSFATAQTVTATAPGTAGLYTYSTITFTAGAQMDSIAAGERYRMKLTRDAATDTMAGNAYVFVVIVKET